MSKPCKSIGCNVFVAGELDFCGLCANTVRATETTRMSDRYPKYYKSVEEIDEIDVYQVHHLFNIQDPSGAIQHASKKLLLSGVRTGGKSVYDDIREARDTLTRWLDINRPNISVNVVT